MTENLAGLFTRALTSAGVDDGSAASRTDERILDAALEEIGEHGTRGATIDAIAARAGVGRITVFRRFGSKEALVGRLGLRELQRFLATVQQATAATADPADRVADAFLACVRVAEEHPLVARLARHEPATAFAQLTAGSPSALDLAVAFIAAQLREIAQETGRVAGDADDVADVLVRLALTYVLVPSARVDRADTAAVRAFAYRVLVPIALRPGVE